MPFTSGTDSEGDFFGIGSRKIENTSQVPDSADAGVVIENKPDREIISTAAGEPPAELIFDQNVPS